MITLKSLDKATQEYERALAKVNTLKERLEQAEFQLKKCEAAKIEAENMEYAKIVRAMNLTVPELRQLQKRFKTELPGALYKEDDTDEKFNYEEAY